jgi:hypothetical protein
MQTDAPKMHTDAADKPRCTRCTPIYQHFLVHRLCIDAPFDAPTMHPDARLFWGKVQFFIEQKPMHPDAPLEFGASSCIGDARPMHR